MYNSFFYTFLLHLLVNNTILMYFVNKYLQVDIAGLCVHTFFFIMHSEFTCILSCNMQNDNSKYLHFKYCQLEDDKMIKVKMS